MDEGQTNYLDFINSLPNGKMYVIYGTQHGLVGYKRSAKVYSFLYFDYDPSKPLYVDWGDGTNTHRNSISLT